MQDTIQKFLGAVALVGGFGLLIFGSRSYAGTRFSVADTLGLGADAQLLGLIVSAIMFFGCGIAVGASLQNDPPDFTE